MVIKDPWINIQGFYLAMTMTSKKRGEAGTDRPTTLSQFSTIFYNFLQFSTIFYNFHYFLQFSTVLSIFHYSLINFNILSFHSISTTLTNIPTSHIIFIIPMLFQILLNYLLHILFFGITHHLIPPML